MPGVAYYALDKTSETVVVWYDPALVSAAELVSRINEQHSASLVSDE